jgi:hypothetical protein
MRRDAVSNLALRDYFFTETRSPSPMGTIMQGALEPSRRLNSRQASQSQPHLKLEPASAKAASSSPAPVQSRSRVFLRTAPRPSGREGTCRPGPYRLQHSESDRLIRRWRFRTYCFPFVNKRGVAWGAVLGLRLRLRPRSTAVSVYFLNVWQRNGKVSSRWEAMRAHPCGSPS